MMRTVVLFMLQSVAAVPSPTVPPVMPPAAAVPGDWTALPQLPWRVAPLVTPAMSRFVASAMAQDHCPPAPISGGRAVVAVDMAVLVAADGSVRQAVPRAIQCPTVEQYSAGLVTGFARDNLLAVGGTSEWYRARLTYSWPA